MPDDVDYDDLKAILADPRSWTPDEASLVRFMIANQKAALAAVHPRDAEARRRLGSVLAQLEQAVRSYEGNVT